MECYICHAVDAGFTKVVFIIHANLRALFSALEKILLTRLQIITKKVCSRMLITLHAICLV
jgi:hypothetical protein